MTTSTARRAPAPGTFFTQDRFAYMREDFDQRVYRVVEDVGPLSVRDVMAELGCRRYYAREALRHLVEAGKVERWCRRGPQNEWLYRRIPDR